MNTMKRDIQLDATYLDLDSRLYSKTIPDRVENPEVVIFNESLAQQLGLDFNDDKIDIAQIFSGNEIIEKTTPFSQSYSGHQFGYFTRLGDGRAIILGELPHNEKRYDIQLKGSGRTPYSRNGDGKATLYSMLREYLISEAMYHLGIPTTRSLTVVATDEKIIREEIQRGAILTRIAESHIRIGTFEHVAVLKDIGLLKDFTDYTIQRHYPDLVYTGDRYVKFFKKVCDSQIALILQWLRVGFIHGVMNTDNVSISGETIDYGPCAFLNTYDPLKKYSSIDHHGRYAFMRQPDIILWNLARLAETLIPLIGNNEEKVAAQLTEILEEKNKQSIQQYKQMLCNKIGLDKAGTKEVELAYTLLKIMKEVKLDYTNTFNHLKNALLKDNKDLLKSKKLQEWCHQWKQFIIDSNINSESVVNLMSHTNPVVIPRNHNVEKALTSAAKGDMSYFTRLLEALKIPYEENPEFQEFKAPPEDESGYETFCGT